MKAEAATVDDEIAISPEAMLEEPREHTLAAPTEPPSMPGDTENMQALAQALETWKQRHKFKKEVVAPRKQLREQARTAKEAKIVMVQRTARAYLARKRFERVKNIATLTVRNRAEEGGDAYTAASLMPNTRVSAEAIVWAQRMFDRNLEFSQIRASWADTVGLTGLSKDGNGPEIVFRIWRKARVTSQKDKLRLAFPGLTRIV